MTDQRPMSHVRSPAARTPSDRPAADRDRGTTLLEVIVTMIMLGIITSVVAFAVTTTLRVTPTTASDIDESRSLLGLTNRFAADVSSTPEAGVTLAPSTLACIGSEVAAGDNLVELRWTADEPTSVEYVAAYRSETAPSGRVVRRYVCSDAAGFNDTLRSTLTAPLDNSVPTLTAVPTSRLVRMQVQAPDGTVITAEGTTRDPPATLPTTTVAATLPPPTPCAATFDSSTYGPVARKPLTDPDAPEELDKKVDVSITISGDTCSTLTLEYDTGFEPKSRPFTVTGTIGHVEIPEGDAGADTPRWTGAIHVLSIHNDGAALTGPGTTADLDVTP